MKYIYKVIIVFIGILVVSCNADDVDNRPVLEAVAIPEITDPKSGKEFLLIKKSASEEAGKFVWSAAKYSTSVVVRYTLLIDKKGGNFTAAKTLATTSNITQVTILVGVLNQAAIDLGAKPDVAALYDIKVMSSVSGGVPMTSEIPIRISVTPY